MTELRADAQRNRERILIAAENVFLDKGAGASLEEVAKRAGVGIGTLYRRFPTRESLLAATCSARFLALAETSHARQAHLDPGSAVKEFLKELVTATKVYRSFATSLGTVLQSGTPGCHAINEEGQRLVRCAHQVQAMRHDVVFDDLICVAAAILLAVEQASASQSRVDHLLDVFLNGIVQAR